MRKVGRDGEWKKFLEILVSIKWQFQRKAAKMIRGFSLRGPNGNVGYECLET